jgi:SAM-dependent methyltransferase
MTPGDPGGPNAEQVRYWNEVAGQKWVARQALLDAQIGPLGLRAIDAGAIAPGEHVLDVGCGCGDSTLALAGRVGAAGSVTGIDVSAVMLARARERTAGLVRVELLHADAQTHPFPAARHDVLFSRFGVMFFTDPTAAFTNLATALRPGGRLAFVCWQALERNPWLLVPLEAAARHITLPPPPDPGAPGPFAFADPRRVRGLLAAAGFRDIALAPVDDVLAVGGGANLDATVEFLLQIGPAGAALREADPAAYPAVAAAVREALAPFAGPAGVHMPAAAWIVTARRP